MRYIVSAILSLLFYCTSNASTIDITSSGRQFRSEIQSFLRQEGFSPYIDTDESLCFKQNGKLYWINVIGDKPFYIQFFRTGFNADEINELQLLRALNYVNTNLRAIKCCYFDNGVSLSTESYCHVAEDFKYVFYKYLKILNLAYEELDKQYNKNNTTASLPISISNVEIGITDGKNNVLTQYGKKLYSNSTKYLTPRVTLYAKYSGTYDIYCKFYDANGNLSTGANSPSGYSWKLSQKVVQGNGTYSLSGWGSANYGHWRSGNYRMELYYQGTLLTTKYFTIY